MSDKIASLYVSLGLDGAKLNQGLKNAQAQATRTMAKIGRVSAVAVTALTGAMAVGVKKQLGFIDTQAKNARAIGGSIDALRALQIAASDAGFDGIDQAMMKLNKRIGEAVDGTGKGVKAFDKLGLAAGDLAKMDADERLATIADRVKELGLNTAETTKLANRLGIENARVVNYLMQGGDAIRKAAYEVKDFGLSLSEVDAAKIEAANDAMSRIGFASEAFLNRVTVTFAPALEAIAVGFTNSMREGGMLRVILDAIANNLDRIGWYAGVAVVGLLSVKLAFLGARVAAIGFASAAALARAALIRTGFGIAVVAIGELAMAFREINKVTKDWGTTLEVMGAKLSLIFGDAAKTVAEAAAKAGNAIITKMTDALNTIVNTGQAFAGAFVAVWQSISRSVGSIAIGMANTAIGAIEGLLNKATGRVNQFIGTVNGLLAKVGAGGIGGLEITNIARIDNPFEGGAGITESIQAAVTDAFSTNFLTPDLISTQPIDDWLTKGQGIVGDWLTKSQGIVDAYEAQRAAVAATKEELPDFASELIDVGAALDGVAGGGGKGASGGGAKGAADAVKKLGDTANEAKSPFQSLTDQMAGTFSDIITGSKNAGEAIKGMLQNVAKQLANNAFKSLFDGLFNTIGGGLTGGSGGGLGGIFGKLLSFNGGGFTPNVPRSGGLDGKGGFLAMMHGNEQVIDHTRKNANVRGLGNNVMNISIDAKGADSRALARVEQEVRNLRENVPKIAVGANNRYNARGSIA